MVSRIGKIEGSLLGNRHECRRYVAFFAEIAAEDGTPWPEDKINRLVEELVNTGGPPTSEESLRMLDMEA